MKKLILITSLVYLFGCVNTIDSYVFKWVDEENTKKEIKYVLNQLPVQKRYEFVVALVAIQYMDVKNVEEIYGDPTMTDEVNFYIVGKKIDGLTYEKVLELADSSPNKATGIYK